MLNRLEIIVSEAMSSVRTRISVCSGVSVLRDSVSFVSCFQTPPKSVWRSLFVCVDVFVEPRSMFTENDFPALPLLSRAVQ